MAQQPATGSPPPDPLADRGMANGMVHDALGVVAGAGTGGASSVQPDGGPGCAGGRPALDRPTAAQPISRYPAITSINAAGPAAQRGAPAHADLSGASAACNDSSLPSMPTSAAAPQHARLSDPPPDATRPLEYLFLSSTFVHQKLRAFDPPCAVEVQVEEGGAMHPGVYAGRLVESAAKGYYSLDAPPRGVLLGKDIFGIRLKTDGRVILQIRDRDRPLATDEGRRRLTPRFIGITTSIRVDFLRNCFKTLQEPRHNVNIKVEINGVRQPELFSGASISHNRQGSYYVLGLPFALVHGRAFVAWRHLDADTLELAVHDPDPAQLRALAAAASSKAPGVGSGGGAADVPIPVSAAAAPDAAAYARRVNPAGIVVDSRISIPLAMLKRDLGPHLPRLLPGGVMGAAFEIPARVQYRLDGTVLKPTYDNACIKKSEHRGCCYLNGTQRMPVKAKVLCGLELTEVPADQREAGLPNDIVTLDFRSSGQEELSRRNSPSVAMGGARSLLAPPPVAAPLPLQLSPRPGPGAGVPAILGPEVGGLQGRGLDVASAAGLPLTPASHLAHLAALASPQTEPMGLRSARMLAARAEAEAVLGAGGGATNAASAPRARTRTQAASSGRSNGVPRVKVGARGRRTSGAMRMRRGTSEETTSTLDDEDGGGGGRGGGGVDDTGTATDEGGGGGPGSSGYGDGGVGGAASARPHRGRRRAAALHADGCSDGDGAALDAGGGAGGGSSLGMGHGMDGSTLSGPAADDDCDVLYDAALLPGYMGTLHGLLPPHMGFMSTPGALGMSMMLPGGAAVSPGMLGHSMPPLPSPPLSARGGGAGRKRGPGVGGGRGMAGSPRLPGGGGPGQHEVPVSSPRWDMLSAAAAAALAADGGPAAAPSATVTDRAVGGAAEEEHPRARAAHRGGSAHDAGGSAAQAHHDHQQQGGGGAVLSDDLLTPKHPGLVAGLHLPFSVATPGTSLPAFIMSPHMSAAAAAQALGASRHLAGAGGDDPSRAPGARQEGGAATAGHVGGNGSGSRRRGRFPPDDLGDPGSARARQRGAAHGSSPGGDGETAAAAGLLAGGGLAMMGMLSSPLGMHQGGGSSAPFSADIDPAVLQYMQAQHQLALLAHLQAAQQQGGGSGGAGGDTGAAGLPGGLPSPLTPTAAMFGFGFGGSSGLGLPHPLGANGALLPPLGHMLGLDGSGLRGGGDSRGSGHGARKRPAGFVQAADDGASSGAEDGAEEEEEGGGGRQERRGGKRPHSGKRRRLQAAGEG